MPFLYTAVYQASIIRPHYTAAKPSVSRSEYYRWPVHITYSVFDVRMVYEKTLRPCQNRKAMILYPNISDQWYRNLDLPNAILKINSLDGLRGMTYAESECIENTQTLLIYLIDI